MSRRMFAKMRYERRRQILYWQFQICRGNNRGSKQRGVESVRSGMAVYVGAARRRVHLAMVLLLPRESAW